MNALLQQFLAEGRDLLQRMAEILLMMEQQRDPALMAELFRTVHTLKGNSGLFSFPEMTQVLHAAEDVMDAVRHERLSLSSHLIDQLLHSCDFVTELFDDIERTDAIASYRGTPALHLSTALRQLLSAPVATADRSVNVATSGTAPSIQAVFTQTESAHAEFAQASYQPQPQSPPAITAPALPAWLDLAWLDPSWLERACTDVGGLDVACQDLTAHIAADVTDTAEVQLFWLCYTPDAQCFFNGEDPFFSMRQLAGLRFLVVKPQQPWFTSAPAQPSSQKTTVQSALPLDFDVYDCQLQFVALVATTEAVLAQHFRYVRDQVQWLLYRDIAPRIHTTASRPDHTAALELTQLAALTPLQLAIIAAQYQILQQVQRETLAETSTAALLPSHQPQPHQPVETAAWQDARTQAALLSLQASLHDSALAVVLSQQVATAAALQSVTPILRWLVAIEQHYDMLDQDWQQQATQALTLAASTAAIPSVDAELRSTTDANRTDTSDVILAGAAITNTEAASTTAAPPSSESMDFKRRSDDHAGNTLLKVEQRKIDRLVELIGEMVVAKNALPYIARKTEQGASLLDIGRDIKQSYAVIHRIADEMQDAIMQVRMMPMSFVLQRFPRLVRDLARKLNKEVQLQLSGEDTEADKNIIEALADPLMHIVRNSLDHGLEAPHERLAAGKTAVGHLKIHAKQDADRVLIRIEDDGRGIDPELVKRKAWEKGLISDEERARLTDEDAIQLIFRAGFSTAEQISDLSGRGVGMDVVRNALLAVGGSVQLQSKRGQGTQLLLSLPLSMAVSHVMMIETQQQLFGVPMDAVIETVRLRPEQLFRVKQQQAVVLREKIVPLFALNQLLALDAPAKTNADGEFAALIIELDGHPAGLLVDEFKGVIDVILKPLPGELAQLRCYSGSTLLGDGSVLMVLNPRGLW